VKELTREQYINIENYMLSCMKDSAHDKDHIYRVLFVALDIAHYEAGLDMDVLVAACLLHDIGREEQNADPSVCHALAGGEKAYVYLKENDWDEAKARHIKACIETHRYRTDRIPETTEAKIVFDADKIDATGTLGIARTILYRAEGNEPLYTFCEDGSISDGTGDVPPSFFHEYKFKLEKLYGGFHTKRGSEIALSRQRSATDFYASMLEEVRSSYDPGKRLLAEMLENGNER
jgi:uncharacterized protein